MKLYTGSLNVAVTLNDRLVHAPTADVKLTVGAHVSFMIVYVFELTGHHQVSDIFIITLVIHSAGTNHVDKFDPLGIRVDPLSFDTITVIGDGPHELVMLHVMLDA